MKKEILNTNERPMPNELVTYKDMGNISEIMYMKKRNSQCKIKKIDKDNYIMLDTGEVKQFEHNLNRADDLNNIRVSLGNLRDYMNTNITDVKKCRWVTLTYSQPDGKPMTDPIRLQKDFEKAIKKLRYEYGHFEYIVAMEPQGNSAWHAHVVMIFNKKAPFIPNELMAEKWGQGFVTIKKLDDVDNVGAYLTAYLGDMDLEEMQQNNIPIKGQIKKIEIEDDTGQKITKQYIKGARLHMYPAGFNLYRCSKGIKKPEKEIMTAEKAEKKTSGSTLTFERTIRLSDEQTEFENTINYRYYNKIRKDSQDVK